MVWSFLTVLCSLGSTRCCEMGHRADSSNFWTQLSMWPSRCVIGATVPDQSSVCPGAIILLLHQHTVNGSVWMRARMTVFWWGRVGRAVGRRGQPLCSPLTGEGRKLNVLSIQPKQSAVLGWQARNLNKVDFSWENNDLNLFKAWSNLK